MTFPLTLFRSSWPRPAGLQLSAAAIFCAGLAALPAAARPKWDPIPPADLAATECKDYPDASAEVLFCRITNGTTGDSPSCEEYIRTKIYSLKGIEKVGVLDIDYNSEGSVWNMSARVTKPDGTSTEYGKENFNDAVLVKTKEVKKKRKSLAVPNLGVGDIVEMRWSKTVSNEASTWYQWNCQALVPVRDYVFEVTESQNDYTLFSFNIPDSDIKSRDRYRTKLEMRNLPPYEEEPHMLPERDVRGWFMMVFSHPYLRWYSKPGDLWKQISTVEEEDFRFLIKPSSAIKDKTSELVRGATTDADRLARIYDFCQEEIKNMTYLDSPELQKAKKKFEDNDQRIQRPNQTLQLKTGFSNHVNELFASMARAAGYEVRLALCASRNDMLNIMTPKGWLFLDDKLVAVKVGADWTLYCPGDYYVPAGMIHHTNEFASYLRCEEDKAEFGQVPVAVAAKSPITRKARLQIDADGNLEGDVEISWDGHAGSSRKQSWAGDQQSEIDDRLRSGVTDRLQGAEVSDIVWENLSGRKLPLIVRYKVKVPGYAEAAGSKFVFSPNIFEHKAPAMFTPETRRYPIMFQYAWAEHDDIEISLPQGFNLVAPSAPSDVGDLSSPLGVRYELGYKRKARLLSYHRDFALGGNGAIAFQVASYPKIKVIFDAIHESDEHSLVLKPVPAALANPSPAPETPAPTSAAPAPAPAPATPVTPVPASGAEAPAP